MTLPRYYLGYLSLMLLLTAAFSQKPSDLTAALAGQTGTGAANASTNTPTVTSTTPPKKKPASFNAPIPLPPASAPKPADTKPAAATPTPADDPAPLPPISMDDKFQGRTLQLQESQAVQLLQPTPQYASAVAAQNARAQFFSGLFAKYKVDAQKATVCDGPAPGVPACAGVAKGDIAFRTIPPTPVATTHAELKK